MVRSGQVAKDIGFPTAGKISGTPTCAEEKEEQCCHLCLLTRKLFYRFRLFIYTSLGRYIPRRIFFVGGGVYVVSKEVGVT